MPCAQGTRRIQEDFDLVRSRWQRHLSSCSQQYPSLVRLLHLGEPSALWQELHRLDLRKLTSSEFVTEIQEYVRQTMRRVRTNLEFLVHELPAVGYRFLSSNPLPPPDPEAAVQLDQLESTVGPLPLTLRHFYLEVGAVDFRQEPDQLIPWIDERRSSASLLQTLGEEDPLYVRPLHEFSKACRNSLPVTRSIQSEPGTQRLCVWLAPDECHKANYSGGEDYSILLPEPAVDFPLVGAWIDQPDPNAQDPERFPQQEALGPSEFFITHLRLAMQTAGFRGRTLPNRQPARQPPTWPPLLELARHLELF